MIIDKGIGTINTKVNFNPMAFKSLNCSSTVRFMKLKMPPKVQIPKDQAPPKPKPVKEPKPGKEPKPVKPNKK